MSIDTVLKRERLAKNICAQLNNFVDLRHTLISIMEQLKELTGFEAVSIRLQNDGDYPYYVYNGFPDSFIQKENTLCSFDTDYRNISKGNTFKLDCLCGNVISGTTNNEMPYYTEKGSFWTNDSGKSLQEVTENEPSSNIRGYCTSCGYESIGLFPIKTREENIGLIQLNDKRKDMFSTDIIEFVEMIGEQIGLAVENALLYEKIKEKNTELQNTVDDLNKVESQLVKAKKMSALADLVTGVAHEVYEPVSDSLFILEQIISKTKNNSNKSSTEHLENILNDVRDIYKNLSNVNGLVKSFKSIALDQFQENRHLINVKSFLNDIVRIIKPSLRKKDVEFIVDCNDNLEIMSFSGVLSQIISILIQNSYEHGFKKTNKGVISIQCVVRDEENIELKYSDNGVGIEDRIKHLIFEPFYTTDQKKYTGLGLYIAKNLAESKLNGNLILDEHTTKGVLFVLKLQE